jgi:Rod binding domain-containing protein
MPLDPLSAPRIDLSSLPLERLAASTQASEREKIGEASRAFEALLLRQILQESQKPVFASKPAGNSTADGIYRDMVVSQLAENISQSGSVGLAQGLAGELQRQARPAAAPAPAAAQSPASLSPP